MSSHAPDIVTVVDVGIDIDIDIAIDAVDAVAARNTG